MASLNKEFKICPICKNKFFRPYRYSFKEWNNKKYCSKSCYGESRKGEKSRNWKGGRKTSKMGYVEVYKPDHFHADCNGYVKEHIFIITEHLHRSLSKDEVVHHINGIKADNRIENLKLMKKGEHNSNHAKGRKVSTETKNKISEIRKKRIPIIKRNLDGTFKGGVLYGI